MSAKHENNCSYCKHKFCYKFRYRTWKQVADFLYERAKEKFEPIQTITFVFDGKVLQMNWTCGDYKPREGDGCLSIELVDTITEAEAEKRGNPSEYMTTFGYTYPKELPPKDRDLKLLRGISKKGSMLDLDIRVDDRWGGCKNHHCGISKISGYKNVKIELVSAWYSIH